MKVPSAWIKANNAIIGPTRDIEKPPFVKELDYETELCLGLAVALEVKAVKDDRIFIEFGPQVIVTRDGPRVMNPDALDVVEL